MLSELVAGEAASEGRAVSAELRAADLRVEVSELLERVSALEQKLANRDLLLERVLIFLRAREEKEFVAEIEKHLGVLEEVEGEKPA